VKTFDEGAFVFALTERDLDSRDMKRVFKAEWLKNKEYVPLVKAIYAFIDEYAITPSLASLAEYMEDNDKSGYESRYKATIEQLKFGFDNSKQMLAVKKAKEKAAAFSLESMMQTAGFQKALAEGEGEVLLADMSRWLTAHTATGDELILDIKTALDTLIKETPWTGKPARVPTGVLPIDEWSYGGLRPGQLGIVIAPTGGGKSACLLNIAYNVAMTEGRQVLMLTNELSRDEQSERFLARMHGDEDGKFVPLQIIQDDPVEAYRGLDIKWQHGLHKRLMLGSIDLNTTAENIEASMVKLRAEYGFEPELIVIDYMEKMAPSRQVKIEKEWIYLQEIAKELIRLGVRRRANIWTAVQTNRSGMNRKIEQSMEFVQGSIRHLQAADCVVSCRKVFVNLDVDGNEQVECLEFAEHKQRSSKMEDRKMLVRTNLEQMLITNQQIIPQDEESVEDEDEREEGQQERKAESAKKRGGKAVLSPREASK
jgi:KaiC/GvpD/RAD55 family RecA-like ATPase